MLSASALRPLSQLPVQLPPEPSPAQPNPAAEASGPSSHVAHLPGCLRHSPICAFVLASLLILPLPLSKVPQYRGRSTYFLIENPPGVSYSTVSKTWKPEFGESPGTLCRFPKGKRNGERAEVGGGLNCSASYGKDPEGNDAHSGSPVRLAHPHLSEHPTPHLHILGTQMQKARYTGPSLWLGGNQSFQLARGTLNTFH